MLPTETKSTGQMLLGDDGCYCDRKKVTVDDVCEEEVWKNIFWGEGGAQVGGGGGGGRNPNNLDEASSQSVKSFERMCAGEIKAIKTNCF